MNASGFVIVKKLTEGNYPMANEMVVVQTARHDNLALFPYWDGNAICET
jgi:hypothetical protein